MNIFLRSFVCLAGALLASSAFAQSNDAASISSGKAVAIAGDCAGCHAALDGSSDFSGGLAIASPMGRIYARNITPDTATGIGGWTYEDFSRAMRKGKSKTVGNLFPAMPYTSYKHVSEQDMRALYDYLQNEVKPVNHAVPETKLGFPFIRPAMGFWNMMFANANKPRPLENADDQVMRGQYLVETLGHCGECHTPRGVMMQTKGESYRLSGGVVGGWYAPNITSDPSGIGQTSNEDLKAFLTTGKTKTSIAAGDMDEVIERSLSKMPASDIDAIVAYLKAAAPVKTAMKKPVLTKVAPLNLVEAEPTVDPKTSFDATSTVGAVLYQSACASCHGVNGDTNSGARPSLVQNASVRAAQPNNVIQAIVYGIDLGRLDTSSLMPAFKSDMSDAQVAAVAAYVRQRFGGIDTAISAADVTSIRSGRAGVSWLMLNARGLAWAGVIALLLVLAAAAFLAINRSKPKRSAS